MRKRRIYNAAAIALSPVVTAEPAVHIGDYYARYTTARVMHLVSKFAFANDDDNGADSGASSRSLRSKLFCRLRRNPPLHDRNQVVCKGAFLHHRVSIFLDFRRETSIKLAALKYYMIYVFTFMRAEINTSLAIFITYIL